MVEVWSAGFNQRRERLDIKKCDSEYKTKLLDFSHCLFIAKQSCFAAHISKIRHIDQPEKDTKPQVNFFKLLWRIPNPLAVPAQALSFIIAFPSLDKGWWEWSHTPDYFWALLTASSCPLQWAAQDGRTAHHWALTQRAFQGNEQFTLVTAEITAPHSLPVVIDGVIQSTQRITEDFFYFLTFFRLSVSEKQNMTEGTDT